MVFWSQDFFSTKVALTPRQVGDVSKQSYDIGQKVWDNDQQVGHSFQQVNHTDVWTSHLFEQAVSWAELCALQIQMLKSWPPVSHRETMFGDRAFREVIKVKWGLTGGP